MFDRLRKRHGNAFPVAILALIVAVAFAGVPAVAAPVANTSASLAKKVSKALGLAGKANKRSIQAIKLARSAAGTPGPPGVPGLPGPAGPKGDAGSNGSNGSNGANGKSVTVSEIPAEEAECNELGGAEVKQEGAGSGVEVCNGESGFTAALPSGKTETGVWTLGEVPKSAYPPGDGGLGGIYVPISFAIPLAAELDEDHVHFIDDGGEEVVIDGGGNAQQSPPADCPGSAAEPLAEPGHLCVYAGKLFNTLTGSNLIGRPGSSAPPFGPFASGEIGASTAGALINFMAAFLKAPPGSEHAYGWGAWAVTAP